MTYYLINEQATPHEIKILSEQKNRESGCWSVTFQTILQELDKVNQNNRIYTRKLFKNVAEPLIKQRLAARELVGEYDHPLKDIITARNEELALKRQISILLEKVSHMFLDIWLDGPYVMGKVKTLHTKYGRELTNLIVVDKVTVGFSMRSIGRLERVNGIDYVAEDGFRFVTYDVVWNPSNEKAKFYPIKESVIMKESIGLLNKDSYSSENIEEIVTNENLQVSYLMESENTENYNRQIIPACLRKDLIKSMIKDKFLNM